VLACLDKDPGARPQSAAELRQRIEACTVEPWDSDRARTWWSEHQFQLDGPVLQSLAVARTTATAAPHRSAADAAG
jgi:hypothetical protein